MDIGSIVASGMQAMRTKADAHAHNLANARTPGYQRLVARTMERSEGGVDLSIERDPSPGSVPVEQEEAPRPLSADGRSSAGPIDGTDAAEAASSVVQNDLLPSMEAPSNVDPVEEVVGMKEAAAGMSMLAAVYQRHDEAVGTLFDAFG